MNERGAPSPVAWTRLRAPESLMAMADPAAMKAAVEASPRWATYSKVVDRESAHEILLARATQARQQAEALAQQKIAEKGATRPAPRGREDVFEAATKSAARAIGSSLGRQVIRGVLGAMFGGGRR
jgi:hypothetical protein